MKTTIDISEDELKQAMRFTRSHTKREAINRAVSDYNRRQRLARLAEKLGTFSAFMTANELRIMREDSKWQKKV